MMSLLRKHRQWLMIVIAILALPFCLYFVKTDYSQLSRPDEFARLYNRKVTNVEAQRNARLHDLAIALGMEQLAQSLSAGAQTREDVYKFFTYNRIILQHEAEELGIRPTQSELADHIRKLKAFQGGAGFDPIKYREFSENILPANGFTDAQIEELASDELSLIHVKQLVTVGLSVPESESKDSFEQAHGKLIVHAIRIRGADFEKEIKINDEDVQKYFEAHKNELKTDEKRKIEFVVLGLTDDQKKLAGKERIDALQKLADRANELTQALAEKGADFHQVAAKFQLPVKLTGEFTAGAPDPQLKEDPQLSTTAFQLSAQEPNSEAVQIADGFYVLHLAGVAEARLLTVEEAKGKIVDAIKSTRLREMAAEKGRQISQELRAAQQTGAPLPPVLEKAHLKADKIPPFTLMEAFDPSDAEKKKDRPKDFVGIKNAVGQLQPGEISEFFPWEDGGLIVYLEKREPPDEVKYREEKPAFDERLARNKREIVFEEWLRDRQRDAGVPATPKEMPQMSVPRKS